MDSNTSPSGFSLFRTVPLEELGGSLWEYRHQKTGAKLCWLDRPEENKTFAIAFSTTPEDDTGVFHILEHSVLCGSQRYPVKEPFVELLKNSLNTFLNAFTFPDKTMYPVCSRNQEDFQNLMSVYLDAVFHPLIYQKPEIFRQEGWHYEVEPALSYKGVVFNEMKGAIASVDTRMEAACTRRLFPENCYRFVSGGDPSHIPELTYGAFLNAHRRFYHPSNALIYLDGSLDLEPVLALLEQALSPFSPREAAPPIPFQAPVDGGWAEEPYELSPSEPLEGRCRLGLAFGAGTFRDREQIAALYALSSVLCGNNQAPLKRCLLEKGLAKEVRLTVNDGVQQPWLLLEAQDIRREDGEAVRQALEAELSRLAGEGLDRRQLSAALDNLEFQARQRDYGRMPQGLVLGFQVLESWLYGGAPEANLEVGSLYQNLRDKLEQGYFEGLLRTLLLENPHRCQVLLVPSHTLGQEREVAEKQRLESAAALWTQAERRELLTQQKQIETWQQTPDTAEALAALPRIQLEQISREPLALPTESDALEDLPVLFHQAATGGILHLNLYFALDDLSPEQLPGAALLSQLLTNVPTQSRTLEDLQREVFSRFGSLSFSVEAYGGEPGTCRVFLAAQCSLLEQKLAPALELLREILTQSLLSDEKAAAPFLSQRRALYTQRVAQNGHNTALTRVMARSTAQGVVTELTSGVSFLRWLRQVEEHFSERFPSLGEKLLALSRQVFVKSRLTLSATCQSKEAAGAAASLLNALPQGAFSLPQECRFQPWEKKREGILIPGDVAYSAMGGAFPRAQDGKARVMGHVLSLDHLWNRVRVQGGAYGTGMVLQDSGFAGCYSYRDPTPARTAACFEECPSCLGELPGQEMTGRIIGTVAESEPLLTPRLMGKTADSLFWRGISQEDRCRQRQEILSATGEELASLAAPLEELLKNASLCVVGPRPQMEACKDLLDEVTQL